MLKRIKKIIRNRRIIFITGLVLGIIVSASGVYAANTIYAKNVTYDNSNSGLKATNVQDALDETYAKCVPTTIVDIMKKDAILDTRINFHEISSDTNGKGVYIRSGTENNTNPIYYYRGAVDNNNVLFADTCWKIVRTTETGGTKLIYNGVPSDTGTCNNTGSASQIGTKAFNLSSSSLAFVGYMYGGIYNFRNKAMKGVTDTYHYGNDVIYSGGKYTLIKTTKTSDWSSIYSGGLNSKHYTCMGGTTCSKVYYIYYTTSTYMYYIELMGGKTVEDALSSMLDNNTISSTIKGNNTTSGTLDYWYYTNIEQKGYSSYIEDTVWCNDRSIYQLNGWNPDGGSTRSDLRFSVYDRVYYRHAPSLSCSRNNDKFTVSSSNGNGALDYPVGLLTADEIMLAGGKFGTSNSSYYLYTGSIWWVGSPGNLINTGVFEFFVNSTGTLGSGGMNSTNGVRPSVSLQPRTLITGGDGTIENPYIVLTG